MRLEFTITGEDVAAAALYRQLTSPKARSEFGRGRLAMSFGLAAVQFVVFEPMFEWFTRAVLSVAAAALCWLVWPTLAARSMRRAAGRRPCRWPGPLRCRDGSAHVTKWSAPGRGRNCRSERLVTLTKCCTKSRLDARQGSGKQERWAKRLGIRCCSNPGWAHPEAPPTPSGEEL